MRNKLILIFFTFLFFELHAQNENGFSVVFYNTENLFDWKDDPHSNDNEFTPEGERHWTYNRFEQRIQNTGKVLINAHGWDTPAIIGLCEVENRVVLERLLGETPLKQTPYKIIHKDSPDPRGIDVAMFYNSNVFYPLTYRYIPLLEDDGSVRNTREILYASGVLAKTDTIHFFVNHWPSRYSGLLKTRPLRNRAAAWLRHHVDSLFQIDEQAKIIIMGDFNDQPNDESIQEYLRVEEVASPLKPQILYNLSLSWAAPDVGTLKYQAQWFIFDQIIVSDALLRNTEGLYAQADWATIIDPDFLFETDERYGGRKLKRTYIGYSYNGGFSDHLPVKLKIGKR